jgi:hypothetical protein
MIRLGLSVCLGIVIGMLADHYLLPARPTSTEACWRIVHEAGAYCENIERKAAQRSTESLPGFPQNLNYHKGIVWAEANPTYTDFVSKGPQPLHLKIWFKPDAKSDVQQLIRELDVAAEKGRDGKRE